MSSFTLSVVFMLWFNFILCLIFFLLFQIHYHTLPYPETKENNTCTRDKIEPKHNYTCTYRYFFEGQCEFVNYVNVIKNMYLTVLDYNVFVHELVIRMYIVLYALYSIVIKIFDGVHLALHRL